MTGLLPPIPGKRCAGCNALSTPLWRNGPLGPKTLCNACGVRDNRLKARAVRSSVANACKCASAELATFHPP